jgi:4-amino-4-deoxy-L-arabinose transferase-like glycosyltransferase
MSTTLDTALLHSRSAPGQNQRVSTREVWLCIAILFTFFLACVHAARLRPFWFDELSTLFVANAPTIRDMFRAAPTDGNPPLYFLLARLFLHLPLKMELALRLPSVLAYILAAITVYCFVRRDAGRIYALLSMSMFLGCTLQLYAVEARAYSLLLAFTGITICSWQYYRQSGRRWALAGISLGVLGAILTHQYGVIYATLPLIAGESVRALRLRTLDGRVVYAVAIPALAILLTYPTTLRTQQPLLSAIHTCRVFWGHPQFGHLKQYASMVPPFVTILAVLACAGLPIKLALVSPVREEEPTSTASPEDLSVAVTLTLLLPVMLLVTHFGTNYFHLRYGIGSALGISLLSGLLLSRLRWRHASQLVWVVFVYSLAVGILGIRVAGDTTDVAPWNDPILRDRDAKEPIVVASALEFSPMWWYADEQTRHQLNYLADLDYARQQSDPLPEYSLSLERSYTPMQMGNYQSFVQSHHHFLLYCYGQPGLEWVKKRLVRDGWRLSLLQSAKVELINNDDGQQYRELYMATHD